MEKKWSYIANLESCYIASWFASKQKSNSATTEILKKKQR